MIEKVRFVLLYLVLVTESVVQTHAAEPTDLAWTRVKGADHWTEVVARAVTAAALPKIVPADVSAFCPSYEQSSTADRSHFWVGLIAAIADAETAGRFNPRDSYIEPMHEHGPQSPLVVSRGLLQLSFPGDRDTYQCEIADAQALYDPSVNLACGVRILAKLVTHDQRIAGQVGSTWKGGAAYWSTLRSSGGIGNSNARNLAKVERDTQGLSVCRAHN